jgi:threonine synthase
MDVVFDDDALAQMGARLAGRPFDMWRYREALPIPEGAMLPPVVVGGSPVCEAPRLAAELGVDRLVVKDDGRNPSASLKDRASAVGVVMAVAAGAHRIACASTGNAASSCACIAASMSLPATIFVPERAPRPKVAQLRMFGAQVFRVASDYDTAWELCGEVTAVKGWFNRNCAINPYLVEGKKTVSLELAEQLGDGITDWVAVSVGDGCTIAGVVKGLEQARQAGLIPRVPRVLGVQAEGAQPLVEAYRAGATTFRATSVSTVADSICVGHPRNGIKALDAVRRVNGDYVAVSDEDILESMRQCARLAGVFGEPAGVAAVAGVREARAQGIIGASESVALVVTGNGLKDVDTAIAAVTGPIDVAPSLEAVLAAL